MMWTRTAVGVLAAVPLVGCGSSAAHRPASSKPVTPEARYLATLRHVKLSEGSLSSYSDGDLISAGRAVCDILAHPDRQTFSRNPVDDLVHSGWDVAPAEVVAATAKSTICGH